MIGKLVNSDQLCRGDFKRMDVFCSQPQTVGGLARRKKKTQGEYRERKKKWGIQKKAVGHHAGLPGTF